MLVQNQQCHTRDPPYHSPEAQRCHSGVHADEANQHTMHRNPDSAPTVMAFWQARGEVAFKGMPGCWVQKSDLKILCCQRCQAYPSTLCQLEARSAPGYGERQCWWCIGLVVSSDNVVQ